MSVLLQNISLSRVGILRPVFCPFVMKVTKQAEIVKKNVTRCQADTPLLRPALPHRLLKKQLCEDRESLFPLF